MELDQGLLVAAAVVAEPGITLRTHCGEGHGVTACLNHSSPNDWEQCVNPSAHLRGPRESGNVWS